MDDYFPGVTPDPNLAAVLRDRDIWKERAKRLEAALQNIRGEADLRLRGEGSLAFIKETAEYALRDDQQ
jgi:hypothetical protein